MLERPHLEFLQSQNLAWQARPGGGAAKALSRDPGSGAETLILRLDPGEDAELPAGRDAEIFVLRGALAAGGRVLGLHGYAFLPGEAPRRLSSASGALAILCTWDGLAGHPEAFVDSARLPWEPTSAAHIAHLNAFRKNLRLDPDGRCRTYLLAGLPQGVPAASAEPLESHPHVGEAFLIAGDMATWRGTMRPGAYIWRPPDLLHGADCSATGFFFFMRTPGVNATRFTLDAAPHPVGLDPAHRPILPPGIDGAPVADPLRY